MTRSRVPPVVWRAAGPGGRRRRLPGAAADSMWPCRQAVLVPESARCRGAHPGGGPYRGRCRKVPPGRSGSRNGGGGPSDGPPSGPGRHSAPCGPGWRPVGPRSRPSQPVGWFGAGSGGTKSTGGRKGTCRWGRRTRFGPSLPAAGSRSLRDPSTEVFPQCVVAVGHCMSPSVSDHAG